MRVARLPGLVREEVDDVAPRPFSSKALQLVERNLGLLAAPAEAEDRLGLHARPCGRAGPRRRGRSARCRAPGRRAAGLGPSPLRPCTSRNCSELEQVQHGRLSIGSGLAGTSRHFESRGRPSRNGIAVGIEEAAAVGRQAQRFVLDAAVDGTERGQQAAPGVVPALEDLLAELVVVVLELLAQRRDGVVLRVEAGRSSRSRSRSSAESRKTSRIITVTAAS